MSQDSPTSLYLSGPEKPLFLEKGLYSGYKSRDGLGAILPINLKKDEEYSSVGFLDALPHDFLKELAIQEIQFNIQSKGRLLISFYVLLSNKKIHHCQDIVVEDSIHTITLPRSLANAPNGRLIFFKVKALGEDVEIINWSYSTPEIPTYLLKPKKIKIISRTLGDSSELIHQFLNLLKQYEEAQSYNSDLLFLPFPSLVVYESDLSAYRSAKQLISKSSNKSINIKFNSFNLGGGGNMCLAVYEEYSKNNNLDPFIMIDSDTTIPLRTLYFSTALAACQAFKKTSVATIPTILYSEKPNTILESGALFGRGNWGIASSRPSQPCIAPFFHNKEISNVGNQAAIARSGYTDYPPFIYSIFNAKSLEDKENYLPIPFFLRGDDIELGINLRRNKINCEVKGWLAVFQQPKHSLWHEWMAILHGTCLIFANQNEHSAVISKDTFLGIQEYFISRANCHSRAYDIQGLKVYIEVLKRLVDLMTWDSSVLVQRFHDPSFYIKMRSLNSGFSSSNFKMLEVLEESGEIGTSNIAKVPFLYYEASLNEYLAAEGDLPQRLILVNNTNETANVISTKSIDESHIQYLRSDLLKQLSTVFENIQLISERCKIICSRERIISDYLSQYTGVAGKVNKKSSIKDTPASKK